MEPYKPVPTPGHLGWYEITGYDRYAANRCGEILNKDTMRHTLGGIAGRYLRVAVFKDGNKERTLEYVHDLVCTAFNGPRPGEPGIIVVGHMDNNRMNNKPVNLKWITQSENIKQTYDDGIRLPTYKLMRFAL